MKDIMCQTKKRVLQTSTSAYDRIAPVRPKFPPRTSRKISIKYKNQKFESVGEQPSQYGLEGPSF